MYPENNIRVLMIDDDVVLTQSVKNFFQAEGGFEVSIRNDGRSGAETATTYEYDIIILDVNMPKMNGFETLKKIRQKLNTPVIMLTARGDDLDRILGLEIGADDYVPKPCHLRELVARVRAILRRVQQIGVQDNIEPVSTLGDLTINSTTQTVHKDGVMLSLTAAEFMVLDVLINTLGEIVSKDEIALHALGRKILPLDRSVDVHVGNLRKKLGPLPNGQQRIKTVRGRGYFFVGE